ncbi:MAG: hypothetical protein QHJ82_06625 [Verrucomicrobiota bacterium]|nr:hypothetical protein [Verrucomicrobiota bacterium]
METASQDAIRQGEVAALLMGKVPVNLNYTLSEAVPTSCARRGHLPDRKPPQSHRPATHIQSLIPVAVTHTRGILGPASVC